MNEECEAILDSWGHLHDVPVELSIELGRTRLTLDEVAGLRPNTVVKLPRSTGEGIDIRSGDETLFRGEVVVIDDRAGIRINEIVNEKRR